MLFELLQSPKTSFEPKEVRLDFSSFEPKEVRLDFSSFEPKRTKPQKKLD